MKKTILIIVLAALCLFFKAFAQDKNQTTQQVLHGKITDEQGLALPGATVKIASQNLTTISGEEGKFTINPRQANGTIAISFVGYQTRTIPIPANIEEPLIIQLKEDANSLNEVQVIGYGQTTKRFNTGSVSSISSKEIEEQPVTNVLSALSGKAAGVFVQTNNGLPGGGITIQIRGKGSIQAGTDPLYIIDGVPFASNIIASNSNLAAAGINGAINPLNSLNPQDIESISILKDADATAIYGSRAANGVVLITTKKGNLGKTSTNINISNGISRVTNLPRLLDNQQYLQIRREAYKNDGAKPSADPNDANYAPDLTVWDTTKSTDWRKYILGNTGHVTDAQGSISGGTENTSFLIGGNFHSETTVLPGDNLYQRGGIHMSVQHNSNDHKFYIQFSTAYNADKNQLSNITSNFTGDLLLPPDFPLYDGSGNYNYYLGWNPLADLTAISSTKTSNIILNSLIRYALTSDLNIKASVGYNKTGIDQILTYPTNSQYEGSSNYSMFGNNSNENIIVEPQIEYKKTIGKSAYNLLAGATYQQSTKQSRFIQASNFSSDLLLQNIGSATTFIESNSVIDYKYVSLFGRLNFNYDNRYILNGTIRRDGSSRFGPDLQYGNFGSIGGAWLFSNESWFKESIPFISSGKLRASYGLTGNDQISDYQYLSSYKSSGYNYEGTAGITPSRIANNDFHWETTKKLEFAIELGILKDRVLVNINRYRNRTNDQLVNYSIPYLSGFNIYQANLPADVENSGWEFELNTKNIQTSNFKWETTFNLTLPKNELLSFQNLATSSYANLLVIGQPITRIYGYKYTGIDGTGAPLFQTVANTQTNNPSSATDQYFTIGKGYSDLYGGIGNNFVYRNWSLNIFGQFVKQSKVGGLTNTPGLITNNYATILSRWQSPGDVTNIPKASNSYSYLSTYNLSSANYFNASYFRIKNVSIGYTFSSDWIKKAKIQNLRVYLEGQNLYTFWNRNIPLYDPEAGTGTNIPPLTTVVAGIQLTL